MTIRVLVTGIHGQLVRALAERAAGSDWVEIIRAGRPDLDLGRADSIERAVRMAEPDVVVSAAAYTAVDQAEDEPEIAFRINAEAPGVLARAARVAGAPIIHISTDYVYDGEKTEPYVESDPASPRSVYGHTKLEGEDRLCAEHAGHIILRTAWVYSPFGRNFVRTILEHARTRDRLTVVNDQRGSPTSALDLADAVLHIIRSWRRMPALGLGERYHCAGSGEATWCDLARRAVEESRKRDHPCADIVGIASSEWPTKAARPANSRLDCGKFAGDFNWRAPQWQDSIGAVVGRLLAERAHAATHKAIAR
jgi:dTDP-4-dehydrorhamnose reductase